jgi:hypothetical protein
MKQSGSVSIDEVLNALKEPSSANATTIGNDAQTIANVAMNNATKKVVRSVLPRMYAVVTLLLFIVSNAGIAALIYFAYGSDIEFIRAGKNIPRLVDPDVIKALVAGITIQTGCAFILITNFFFRQKKQLTSEATQIQ